MGCCRNTCDGRKSKELATERLQFFTDISSAKDWLGDIDVMHSNGALQYAPEPRTTLENLCGLGAKQMLWYRVFLGNQETEIQESWLGDNGPGSIKVTEKTVRYARVRIPKASSWQHILDIRSQNAGRIGFDLQDAKDFV
jgi:hypothetical protein